MLGMKLSELTEERLEDILRLYGKICGGKVFYPAASPLGNRIRYIKETLTVIGSPAADFYFGSALKGNERSGKLVAKKGARNGEILISFIFDSGSAYGIEAVMMKERFKTEVDFYLFSNKLAFFLADGFESRENFQRMTGHVHGEFMRTPNNWPSCFGSAIYQAETALEARKAKSYLPPGRGQIIREAIEELKTRDAELHEQYPYPSKELPPKETREELVEKLAIIREIIGWFW